MAYLFRFISNLLRNSLTVRILLAVILIVIMINPASNLIAQETVTSLESLVQDRKESMPGRDSEAYIQPGDDDLQRFENAFEYLKSGDHQSALNEVDRYRYNISILNLEDFPDPLIVLYEELPISRGWGTYIYNPGYAHNSAIQIPHPLFDMDTPEMGIKLFKALQSRWFILAGTHRYANESGEADMSHNEKTVFQTAHKTSQAEWVPQLHGFNDQNPVYDDYPEIIISNGTTTPHEIQFNLQQSLQDRSFTVGVYNEETQDDLSRLAATQNVQGQYSRVFDEKFIHLEFANPLRTQSDLTDQVVLGLQNGFEITTTISSKPDEFPDNFELSQNYPNPFNSSTQLQAKVPGAGIIVFEVYNIIGQRIFTDEITATGSGIYSMAWNAGNMSSGIYKQRVTWYSKSGDLKQATRLMTHVK